MNSEKNRFIHDLRNPLNAISVNAELGKLTLERTGDIRKAISVFEVIIAESRQCNNILETLQNINFATINEGDK